MTEDDYVLMHEMQERLVKLEQDQRAQTKAERARLKELHWMRCPKCGQPLAAERLDSVEIDVCPSCKGVWLDAGELGTIMDKNGGLLQSCMRVIRGTPQVSSHLASKPKHLS